MYSKHGHYLIWKAIRVILLTDVNAVDLFLVLTGEPNKMKPFWQVYVAVEPALLPEVCTVPPCTVGGSGHQSTVT